MEKPLHILGPQFSTFVRSVQLCCEEKGISYTLGTTFGEQTVSFGDGSLFEFHPFGKAPVVIHNDRRLFETASICRYLDTAFDGVDLQPGSALERADVDQWASGLSLYVDRVLVRSYLLEFAFPKGADGNVNAAAVQAAEPEVIKLLGLLDKELGAKPFFRTEHFTIADAILIPMLDYLEKLPHSARLFAEQRYLLPYLNRIRQRPSANVVLG
ncbi:glutathione S-transferase family protein [Budvicia diplopodorum]|uniref:glutathione S-transferase family protein n=1 Tax=Budvicia diplopodorum TaxID=1119056 RepID=UPI00135A8424|nr:glutathione S-transferase family protein [Budvicia diplopodorum]